MPANKEYKKPEITRIKLNAGEAIMTVCQDSLNRTRLVKNSSTLRCRDSLGQACRNSFS